MAKHAKHNVPDSKKKSKKPIAVVVILLVAIIAACIAIVIVRPPFAEGLLETLGVPNVSSMMGISGDSNRSQSDSASSTSNGKEAFSGVSEQAVSSGAQQANSAASASTSASGQQVGSSASASTSAAAQPKKADRTPLIARCQGVDIRSSIAPADLTGVLFHQASYEYGLVLETEIPEANYDEVADSRSMRINNRQSDDGWLDAEALHLWRTSDDTAMDTSIDLGALPGASVYSPVTGTVVLVANYMLYDEMPDIEIHIQPEGRPDLDCVVIHITDATVKAGDRVEAGKTVIAKSRNIEEYLTDVQLGFFTPEGVGGNHVHIQMNDADFEGYRDKKLKDAIKVA